MIKPTLSTHEPGDIVQAQAGPRIKLADPLDRLNFCLRER